MNIYEPNTSLIKHLTCILQSQATKSQHWHNAKQWASYSHRKWCAENIM